MIRALAALLIGLAAGFFAGHRTWISSGDRMIAIQDACTGRVTVTLTHSLIDTMSVSCESDGASDAQDEPVVIY